MNKLPDYLIYRKKSANGEIDVRKLRQAREVGISVKEGMYDFPFSRSAEFFLDKEEAEKLIKALKEYFGI